MIDEKGKCTRSILYKFNLSLFILKLLTFEFKKRTFTKYSLKSCFWYGQGAYSVVCVMVHFLLNQSMTRSSIIFQCETMVFSRNRH